MEGKQDTEGGKGRWGGLKIQRERERVKQEEREEEEKLHKDRGEEREEGKEGDIREQRDEGLETAQSTNYRERDDLHTVTSPPSI